MPRLRRSNNHRVHCLAKRPNSCLCAEQRQDISMEQGMNLPEARTMFSVHNMRSINEASRIAPKTVFSFPWRLVVVVAHDYTVHLHLLKDHHRHFRPNSDKIEFGWWCDLLNLLLFIFFNRSNIRMQIVFFLDICFLLESCHVSLHLPQAGHRCSRSAFNAYPMKIRRRPS